MLWIGIDVGGTFTDAVAYDQAKGTFAFAKAPSTPDDPTRAVLYVLTAMKLDLGSVERLVHGVTIGSAPRGRETPVEEDSTRIIVDGSGS